MATTGGSRPELRVLFKPASECCVALGQRITLCEPCFPHLRPPWRPGPSLSPVSLWVCQGCVYLAVLGCAEPTTRSTQDNSISNCESSFRVRPWAVHVVSASSCDGHETYLSTQLTATHSFTHSTEARAPTPPISEFSHRFIDHLHARSVVSTGALGNSAATILDPASSLLSGRIYNEQRKYHRGQTGRLSR